MDLISTISNHPVIASLCEALQSPLRQQGIARPEQRPRITIQNSHGSFPTFLAAAVAQRTRRPILLVVAHLDEADEAAEELTSFGIPALRLPALELMPGETHVSVELFGERIAVAKAAIALTKPPAQAGGSSPNPPPIFLCPIQALMQGIPEPSAIADLSRTLRRNEEINPGSIVRWLESAGYKRLDTIEEPGDFAVRGGIIDIFPPGGPALGTPTLGTPTLGTPTLGTPTLGTPTLRVGSSPDPVADPATPGVPVRLDFFGDTLDKITEIDTDTMASDRAVGSVDLISASLDRIQSESRTINFLELLPPETIALLHETIEVTEQARGYYERISDSRGLFGPPAVLKLLQDRFAFVEVNQFSTGRIAADIAIGAPVRALPEFSRQADEAVRELAGMTEHDAAHVAVFCQRPGELQRFGELVDEFAPGAKRRIESQLGYIHRGFIFGTDESDSPAPSLRHPVTPSLPLVPYHELLHRFETRHRLRTPARLRAGRAMDTFLDFAPGEYVVHREHGIAKFLGLHVMPRGIGATAPRTTGAPEPLKARKPAKKKTEDNDEGLEEYLLLEFSKGAKLHVPALTIDHVQKYVGGFRGKPQLSTIGGERWKRQKEQVSESVRDLASEMLRIRAAREHLPGIRYAADTAWQKEFEAEFPFEETEDQLAGLAEIKRDMQSERPMDRLVCGDVGYGKTELAIRAAFKAVEFGKQVAVLVPTTVLAEQHERTFRERFADYPFRVESLSRFKSTKEVNDTLAAVRKGQVDVVIGTHRLLSKDIKFSDLGLVVIDEEQRFGVEHKERLLSLRLTVDVLTLSATPIPRTLHMSMLGLRDISSLSTPPLDRRAVVTEVIPYNQRRIQQAIARELARDGQVFFVHNRVYNIKSVADDIHKLAPEARIVVGHGQMPDGELEDVMLRFMRRQADILVSTTIIESGIDIPTANTMFINDADRFGLSDLHQLRGRVGRYKHRAYCYMLLPLDRNVGEAAVKRLKAIEEFSMLGAGFKIAMRDLEIRGAGNILGPEQSGHIAAVGYEMYCQLLERAVKDLKNEPTHVPSETTIEIGVTGLIPKPYIPSDQRRMDAYRRIATGATPADLHKLAAELAQAYGKPPPAVERILDLAELRLAASGLEIRSITVRDKDAILRVPPQRAREIADLLSARAIPGVQARVTTLPPKTGESANEIYFRPEQHPIRPSALLRALRLRLAPAPA